MLTDIEVEIKIHRRNINHYIDKGYDVNIGDIVNIKSSDVMHTVADKIFVICENCKDLKNIRSQNYYNQIKKSNLYVCQKCNYVKVKMTNINRYGTECPLQNADIKKKSEKTLISKYGVDNISKHLDIKNSRRDNFKSEDFKIKSKTTWISKYGVDNPSKSIEIKMKKENTLFENYGVKNPSQSSEIFEKSQKNGKRIKKHECGLMYRGTYEKDFLDYCQEKNLIVEKGPTIEYVFKNKKRYYHSDFFIPSMNLICEIKSLYYYEKYLDINIAKKKYSEMKYNFLFIIDKCYDSIEN
jgi:hypothetical protein